MIEPSYFTHTYLEVRPIFFFGTKVKVVCQGQILSSHFSKNDSYGGISVSQTQLVYYKSDF